MGLRTWLYKKTGIKLKAFEPSTQKDSVDTVIEDLRKANGALLDEVDQLRKLLDEKQRFLDFCKPYAPVADETYAIKEEFQACLTSHAAIQKLLEEYEFKTVIDIGAGALEQATIFARHGKEVTAVDYGVSVYYQQHISDDGISIEKIFGDFNQIPFKEQYDCVWASHILEHQPNVDQFLQKAVSLAKEGGIIAMTVPPFKHEIVGGHVSVWNAGLVLYRLILAGVDCSDAAILAYGYNISIIVRKKTIDTKLLGLEFDCGDIRRMKNFLPKGLQFNSNENDDPFDGNIARLNW